jgi:site-specific DNA recombinase
MKASIRRSTRWTPNARLPRPFINSQRHEGWTARPQKYDDGGYTGANMDRPALKRLLADVESGSANCVVVYKVDRLTRSLLDFARIMEVLDK